MAINTDYLVRNLKARAGHEGPQIVLSWSLPNDFGYDEFYVYRKLGSYPEAYGDGKLVYSGRGTSFSDRTVTDGVIFYYTVFTKDTDGNYHWNDTTKQKSFAYATGRWLRLLLRDITSAQLDFSKGSEILRVEEDLRFGQEFYNYNEDTKDRSTLYRFIKLLSLEMDRIQALIDRLPSMMNIDETDVDFLGMFAATLGIDEDYTIPPPNRRGELRDIVNIYKYKGTKRSLERIIAGTTGHRTVVSGTNKNVAIVSLISSPTPVILSLPKTISSTADAGSTTNTIIDAELDDLTYEDGIVEILTGADAGVRARIISWDNGTKTLTFQAGVFSAGPVGEDYRIFMPMTEAQLSLFFHMGTPYDKIKYLSSSGYNDGKYGYDKYIVFISKGESKLERSSLLRTENKVMVQFAPMNTRGKVAVITQNTLSTLTTSTSRTTIT